MILGIGLDIVDLSSFREQLEDRASSFVEGTFTEAERAVSASRPGNDVTRHLAARYAAKEAFLKAWSAAVYGSPPVLGHVDMREIEVISDDWKRPGLALHGVVASATSALGPFRSHVSLSHDGGCAAAVVLLEEVKFNE